MKKSTFKSIALIGLAITSTLTSCDPDEQVDPPAVFEDVNTPSTYEFNRNGASSVSYEGQTDRLNQLGEMKTYIQNSIDNNTQISADALNDMFSNVAGNGNGNFSFTSGKQLSNKTFDTDRQEFIDMFDRAESASTNAMNNTAASEGTSGTLMRSNGKTILVDENGHEFTQELEKGLMGATFFNQIVNTYLTADKIGDAVDNSTIESGENYTAMEHHFDEAFGYFGAPADFGSNYTGNRSLKYWAKYSDEFDAITNQSERLMNAYKRGRQAITEKKYTVRDAEAQKIHEEMEVLIASAAIHYINAILQATVDGDRMHVASEGYFFLKALRYANINNRKLSQTEVNDMLSVEFDNNFWNLSEPGLKSVKNKLSSTYGLDAIKDQL